MIFWATISSQWLAFVASKHVGHFRQANRWSQPFQGGTEPAARHSHTSVWSDVADGMYLFGGLAASVSTASVTAARAGALHGFAEVRVVSMTCTCSTARRRENKCREGGIWNLVKLEVSLEERLGYCLAGLIRSDDLSEFE